MIVKVNFAMYVCLCKAVSLKVLRRCVEEGARSVDEVGRRCGAGTQCGTCRPDIRRVIDECSARDAREDGLAAK